MADKKISALTAAATPLSGSEVLPIVQGGATVKVSVDDLTTGKLVTTGPIVSVGVGKDRLVIEPQNAGSGALILGTNSAGNAYTPVLIDGSLTKLSVGGVEVARTNSNGIAPVAGKGIDFSANGGDVLTQYDEGTWTPSIGGNATYSSRSGRYTRIGNVVHIQGSMQVNVLGTGSTTTISGLPFVSAQRGGGGMTYFASLSQAVSFLSPVAEGSVVTFEGITVASSGTTDGIAIFGNGAYVVFSATYFV